MSFLKEEGGEKEEIVFCSLSKSFGMLCQISNGRSPGRQFNQGGATSPWYEQCSERAKVGVAKLAALS